MVKPKSAGAVRATKRKSGTDNATHQRILDAALVLFCQSGFDGVTISEIARRAKVAQPIVYYYFQNKSELWKETVKVPFQRLMSEAFEARSELRDIDPLIALRIGWRRFARAALANIEVLDIMIHECRTPSPRLTWLIENYIGPLNLASIHLIEQTGNFTVPPAFFLQAFIGGIYQFLATKNLSQRIFHYDPEDQETLDLFVDFLVESTVRAMERCRIPESGVESGAVSARTKRKPERPQ